MVNVRVIALLLLFVAACTSQTVNTPSTYPRLQQLESPPPMAATHEFQAEYHGRTYSDPYHWLRDDGYPVIDDEPVLEYLKAENAYYQAFLQPNQKLVNRLLDEFKGRTDESEQSVPWQKSGFEYSWVYKPGADYKTFSRTNLATGKLTVFLDVDELAQGFDFFDLGDWAISPDNRYLAYTVNTDGSERYHLVVQDLNTGKTLSDKVTDIDDSIAFTADSKAVIYGKLDEDRWFVNSIRVHRLGKQQSTDLVLAEEHDPQFFLAFDVTSSEQYLLINSRQQELNEVRVVPMNDLSATPVIMAPREDGIYYDVDHANGYFYIRANDTSVDFRLAKAPENTPQHHYWQAIISGADNLYLHGMKAFKNHLVVLLRENGYERVKLLPYSGDAQTIDFPEEVFTAELSYEQAFDQDFIRLNYQSMITPPTVYDYDINQGRLLAQKVKQIPAGYDKSHFETVRLMADARDGVKVPVTLVYKKGFRKDGTQPLFLYGYGAYGYTIPPEFSTERLSLLDRGFAYAIAHIRGGDMMGYQWFLDGKLKKRTNTFNDFVDVAKYLVKENYVAAGNISIQGESAGGELMGVVVTQAPDLWRSVVLGVPFVDVVNTMLDASLPLTPPEWEEWGNPIKSAEDYDLLLSYSPYDNIEAREYPPMLVTGGLNDPRVTYWEPAKFTAKMRAKKTDNNLLLLRTNMGAGHNDTSGRYGQLQDRAEEYAFTLLAHGITE